jgi:hypothetical protein
MPLLGVRAPTPPSLLWSSAKNGRGTNWDYQNADDDDDDRTGRFSHGDTAAWVGNALVLGSLGTLALIINTTDDKRTRQIKIISDILLSTALCVLVWASCKYFIGRRHHWSTMISIVFLIAIVAAFIWLAIVV